MSRFSIDTYGPVLKVVHLTFPSVYEAYTNTPDDDVYLGLWCYFNDEVNDRLFETVYCAGNNISVSNHTSNIRKVKTLLSSKATAFSVDDDDRTTWHFNQYGFSISEPKRKFNAERSKIHKGLWNYNYNCDIPLYRECNDNNLLSGNDILKMFDIFEQQPNILKEVNALTTKLSDFFSAPVVRHRFCFGKWTIVKQGSISIYCNPLGLDCGLSDGADDFAVLFYDADSEVGHQTYDSIIKHEENLRNPVTPPLSGIPGLFELFKKRR